MARGGELSNFRVIRCEFRGFHFSLFESKNGRRISRNLPKLWLFDILGGIHGFLTYGICANGADFASFIIYSMKTMSLANLQLWSVPKLFAIQTRHYGQFALG